MKKEFNPDEIRYLRSLWAVDNVTSTRIIYSKEFKRYFLREYQNGKGPTQIFRDAGLPVLIIGRKRIERCTARWTKAGCDEDVAFPAKQDNGHYAGNEFIAATQDLLESLFNLLQRAERIILLLEHERNPNGEEPKGISSNQTVSTTEFDENVNEGPDE